MKSLVPTEKNKNQFNTKFAFFIVEPITIKKLKSTTYFYEYICIKLFMQKKLLVVSTNQ